MQVWELSGKELEDFLGYVTAVQNGASLTLRLGVDGSTLKAAVGAGTWSPPIARAAQH